MALFRIPPVVDALDDLLDRERQAILRGNLEGLVRLGNEKERLLSQLPSIIADEARIIRLRQKADRNQELLAAVAKGIRAATRQMRHAQDPQEPLRTYTQSGISQEMTTRISSVTKRA